MYIPIVYLVATVTKQSSPTSSCGSCEAARSASDCGWNEESGNFQFAIQIRDVRGGLLFRGAGRGGAKVKIHAQINQFKNFTKARKHV